MGTQVQTNLVENRRVRIAPWTDDDPINGRGSFLFVVIVRSFLFILPQGSPLNGAPHALTCRIIASSQRRSGAVTIHPFGIWWMQSNPGGTAVEDRR